MEHVLQHVPAASPENLSCRAELLRVVRHFFERRGFIEVQTPVLSADTIVDRYVEPIAVTDPSFPTTPHGDRTYYLRTSPEFAMKRLLAAGMEAIYQIGPVFRKGDRGRFHNVEFTMLEWYRAGDDYRGGMNLLSELVRSVSDTATQGAFRVEIAMKSYRDLFQGILGCDPHRASPAALRDLADSNGVAYPETYRAKGETEHWLDLLFTELVQPALDGVVVYDFPASQSQLARTRTTADEAGEYVVAERYELFLRGIEIANGYHELLDAVELRRRFRETVRNRLSEGLPPLPVESRLLAAMESGLPASCGTALGIDRLLMVLLGAESIDRVLAFPFEIA